MEVEDRLKGMTLLSDTEDDMKVFDVSYILDDSRPIKKHGEERTEMN